MAYSEKVIDHYENPRNVGSFDNNDGCAGLWRRDEVAD
jgi:nitrogen fixation NifU-like protein